MWDCRTARWATARWDTPIWAPGRIVYQELTRITKSIEDGEYLNQPCAGAAPWNNAKKPGAALHLMGLLSDGGVHSHNRHHLYGLMEMAKKNGVEKVFIHCFMDGRDVPPTSGGRVYRATAK